MAATKKTPTEVHVTIKPPRNEFVPVLIRGTSNYVSNKFSDEAKNMMMQDQMRGEVDKSRKKKREPKNFEAGFRGSLHVLVSDKDGKPLKDCYGIPCVAFRAAMVRAASLCGVEMTKAKMCVFVMPDGFDAEGNGMVLITRGAPERFDAFVRNDNGSADIRARGRFAPGWEATVTIQYDADFLSADSAVNLLARAGVNVGVGAGRAFSKDSVGQSWGSFEVLTDAQQAAAE